MDITCRLMVEGIDVWCEGIVDRVQRMEKSEILQFASVTDTKNAYTYLKEQGYEVASRFAAGNMHSMKNEEFSKAIDQYVANACEAIRSFAGKSNTGTTYAAVSVENNIYHFSNLGDSRGYLYRGGNLTQMTKDHNVVQELFLLGILTKEQAKHHPDRHTLYQYLDMKDDEEGMILEAYIAEPVEAQPGDMCLLCSDGLTEMVSEKVW